jgi:hypothetical protein
MRTWQLASMAAAHLPTPEFDSQACRNSAWALPRALVVYGSAALHQPYQYTRQLV